MTELVTSEVLQCTRRRTIAEAIVRLVAARGVEAASLRAVAAEAGISMGAVQHYFTTRDEMLLFALEYGNGLLAARSQRLIAERPSATLRENLRLICTLLLPLDAESRAGARVWAALIARGCVDEPTADAYTGLTAFMLRGVGAGQSARHLVSVIEGLRWPLLFGVYTEAEALAVLDAQLGQIFGSTRVSGSGTVVVVSGGE
ncbi:MAG: TetR/AcrR family transcriptional regulator [Streptosporangiaceae bacterium]